MKRHLLSTLALAALALPNFGAQEEQKGPDKARVEETVEALELAFEDGDVDTRIAALVQALEVPHAAVVSQVVRGLRDDELAVMDAALQTLRYMEHADALGALHKTLTRDKRFKNDPELTPKLLRAIGEHADPKSIPLLTKDLFRGDSRKNREVTAARILAVGNIRSKKSVETLIGLMNKASQQNIYPHMRDVRLALFALTGVDKGRSREEWQSWWNDNKKTVEVSPKMAPLPKDDQRRWDRFWGKERQYERRTKRGDRGQD